MWENTNYTIEDSAWTRSRKELRRALSDVAPSLAELYQGSVLLLYQNQLPGWSRFVAHAVREIRNRLPHEIGGHTISQRVDYENSMDRIAHLWRKAGLDTSDIRVDLMSPEGAPRQNNDKRQLPGGLFRAISKLIQRHRQSRVTRPDQARKLFQACSAETDKNIQAIGPVIDQWMEVTEWFVKKAHDSGKTDADFDKTIVIQKLPGSEELDEILAEANK
jgi:hypothetical protein